MPFECSVIGRTFNSFNLGRYGTSYDSNVSLLHCLAFDGPRHSTQIRKRLTTKTKRSTGGNASVGRVVLVSYGMSVIACYGSHTWYSLLWWRLAVAILAPVQRQTHVLSRTHPAPPLLTPPSSLVIVLVVRSRRPDQPQQAGSHTCCHGGRSAH